jgi:hypothetical protein
VRPHASCSRAIPGKKTEPLNAGPSARFKRLWTPAAPARLSVLASSFSVEPVVMTSSTTARGASARPAQSARHRAISTAWLKPRFARRSGCRGMGTRRSIFGSGLEASRRAKNPASGRHARYLSACTSRSQGNSWSRNAVVPSKCGAARQAAPANRTAGHWERAAGAMLGQGRANRQGRPRTAARLRLSPRTADNPTPARRVPPP